MRSSFLRLSLSLAPPWTAQMVSSSVYGGRGSIPEISNDPPAATSTLDANDKVGEGGDGRYAGEAKKTGEEAATGAGDKGGGGDEDEEELRTMVPSDETRSMVLLPWFAVTSRVKSAADVGL